MLMDQPMTMMTSSNLQNNFHTLGYHWVKEMDIFLYQPSNMEHHQWDWNTVLMMELHTLLYYHKRWWLIQQCSRLEINFTTTRYVMHCTVWNLFNGRISKGVIPEFTENTHKYCMAGVQPNHAKTGISLQTYDFSNMSNHHKDTIIVYV